MTRKIFKSVALTCALAVMLAAALVALTLFGVYESGMTEELRAEAGYICHALNREANEMDFFEGFTSKNRVSLIAADGTVLYDSEADASALSSHADRPEVAGAIESGRGESERYSDTLAQTTYYYALRTDAGNVLRVANSRSSMLGIYLKSLPLLCAVLLAVLCVSMLIARVVARRFVAPLNSLNLDAPLENEVYDELSPLLTRMDRQRREIDRQMRALSDARQELAAITENMREGLIVLDRRGCVLSMNGSAATIFGVDAQARVGADMLSVSRDPVVQQGVDAALNGRDADDILERNGRHYQLLASPVLKGGETAGVVLLTLDVTESYAAEVSRREFTANVSHELKTPLTSISGYAEIIRDGVARAEDVPGFAARIHDEASHLLTLINDILELSRLDERKGLGERTCIRLLGAAREAARRLEPLAQEKHISLEVSGEELEIQGDKLLLGEMIFNLVDNAVKYTPEGGRVELRVSREGTSALLSVQDTGIGIPEEHQPHVFERFYRVDKSHSRATGGTGLGLSIVKHGAAIHGAKLHLVSAAGRGTCVTIAFPMVQ